MIRHVSQHGFPTACQQSVIAMLAGVELRDVIALFGFGPMSCSERVKACDHFGIVLGDRVLIEGYGNETLTCLMDRHRALFLSVSEHGNPQFRHCVLWHGGTLYDPALGVNPAWPWRYHVTIAQIVAGAPAL
jgi:hypothetical protein